MNDDGDATSAASGRSIPSAGTCDVCHDAPAEWHNLALLGSDDGLCIDCLTEWYDNGITNKAKIAERVSRARAEIEEEADG